MRIEHAEPKVIVAASAGCEPNRIIRYTKDSNSNYSPNSQTYMKISVCLFKCY